MRDSAKRLILCLAAALFAATATVSASSLTVSIVRTTMDQAEWNQMRDSLKHAIEAYEDHIFNAYGIFGFNIAVGDDAVHFHYYVPYHEYYKFYEFWQPVIDQVNAELAEIGIRYEIHWDEEYPERFGQIVETFPGTVELGDYYGWAPGMSYFYARFFPYVYYYGLDGGNWAYVWGGAGSYYIYVFGRGWVWTPGSFDDLQDL